jgi:poly(3-hydroxybutyrate) depolymerase
LCVNIPESRKHYHLAKGVGHYGVFNGSRFRNEIAPRIREFMAATDAVAEPVKPGKLNGAKRSKSA